MSLIIADRVKEITSTTGTGSFSLLGGSVGYRAFSDVMTTGDTCYYCAVSQSGAQWEIGTGTFTSPATLARTSIQSSSNSGSAVDFIAGTKDIFLALTATQFSGSSLPTQTGNSGKFLTTNGTTASWSDNPLGTVTQVQGTGTINGISLTGNVTSSGNLTLGGALTGVNLASQVTGTLAVTNGGTGTATGSITGTGALVFTAGGSNQKITLSASDATLDTTSNGADVLINTGIGYKFIGVTWSKNYGFLKINDIVNVGGGKGQGQTNAVLGRNALNSFDSPSNIYTVAIGPNALELCTGPYFDVAVGSGVLGQMASSQNNTGVGGAALSYLTSGNRNTAVGSLALGRITSGTENVAVGQEAGRFQANNNEPASFDGCTLIGYQTKVNSANDSNSIVIGYQAVGKGTNSTVIGTTSTNAAWIYGNTLNLGNGASAAAITANGALTVTAGGTNQDVTLTPSGTGKVNAPAIKETVFAITDGASVDINPANGGIQTWTLGANRTPTASSFAEGQSVTLMIDDGTAYAITWSSVSPTWIGGSAPTLATSGFTVIELWKRSSTIYGALVGTA